VFVGCWVLGVGFMSWMVLYLLGCCGLGGVDGVGCWLLFGGLMCVFVFILEVVFNFDCLGV